MSDVWKILVGGSGRFRRNFVQLASSNLAAQIIGLISLPVLSRVYGPADFGSLASFSAIYSIVLSISAFRLDWLIPRAKVEVTAQELQWAGLLIVSGITTIAVMITIGWSITGVAVSSDLVWIPLAILAGGAFLVFQAGYVWRGALIDVGVARLVQALTVVGISLLFGLWWVNRSGLVFGYVAGLIVAMMLVARKDISTLGVDVKAVARILMRIFGRRSAEIFSQVALALINILMTSSPVLLLAAFFDDRAAGEYSIAFRVAVAPVSIITGAVAYSFIAEAAGMMRGCVLELRHFYIRTIRRLVYLAFGAAVLTVLASYILPVVLGEKEWATSGAYLIAVTPYLFGIIVFSPTTHLFLYGKAHLQAIIDIITFMGVLISFFVAKMMCGSPVLAIGLASSIILLGYFARHKAHLVAMARLRVRHCHE